jgi:hypothetical protein
MSRKRSVASIINDSDDEESPLSSSQPHRNRSISSIINEASVTSARPSRNTRRREVCNCPDCNGKLVDSRTKEVHESRQKEYQDSQGTITTQI